jgi:uncharacterized protein (DUF1778 family)
MMTPRTGRPPIENPRNRRLSIRLTESKYQEVEDCARLTGMSKTDLVLDGIRLVREREQKK